MYGRDVKILVEIKWITILTMDKLMKYLRDGAAFMDDVVRTMQKINNVWRPIIYHAYLYFKII